MFLEAETEIVLQKNAHILVVEDEPAQKELLTFNLSTEGFEVSATDTAEEAMVLVEENEFDLILLDWMLPNASGIEACRQLKKNKKSQSIPIIMLTARGEEHDKIRGLDTGADDYVVKPYSIKELMARVRAGLRRRAGSAGEETLSFKNLKMNLVSHRVFFDDKPIDLSPLEFKLLRTFLERPGRVRSRDQLLDRVWKDALDVDTRTVDVHIGRLRKQISKSCGVDVIRTVRGFGYSLDFEE